MADVIVAITNIRPNAGVKVVDNDINKITWLDDNPTNITIEQIQAEMNRMDDKIAKPDKYAYINRDWKRLRCMANYIRKLYESR